MVKEFPINPFAVILDIEKKARDATREDELTFTIVNNTHKLINYQQAILFDQFGKVVAVSGTSSFDFNSPFIYWVTTNCRKLLQKIEKPQEVNPNNYENITGSDWKDWLPNFGYFIPLWSPIHGYMGTLFLSRDNRFNEEERELLNIICESYGYCLGTFRKSDLISSFRKRRLTIKVVVFAVIVIGLLIPVPLSVLAPSEIVAINPSIVRAPIDGVVEKILVKANQSVRKGEVLFLMDSLVQRNELQIARKILTSLKLQYAQLTRQALSDRNSKKLLARMLGGVREQEIRIKNLEQLIRSMRVLAPDKGIVIIDNPEAWEGQFIRLGQKVVSIADKNLVEVESWLSVSDVIDVKSGAIVRVYLNLDPLNSLTAKVRSFSYEAQERPGNIYAYRIRSMILDKENAPRLGLRGTAKIIGDKVPFVYWVLRRPIAVFRQFVGL